MSICPDLIIDCGSIAGDLLSGEFLKFINELRSYEMRVPPGVVPYREPPGVDDSGIIWPVWGWRKRKENRAMEQGMTKEINEGES